MDQGKYVGVDPANDAPEAPDQKQEFSPDIPFPGRRGAGQLATDGKAPRSGDLERFIQDVSGRM